MLIFAYFLFLFKNFLFCLNFTSIFLVFPGLKDLQTPHWNSENAECLGLGHLPSEMHCPPQWQEVHCTQSCTAPSTAGLLTVLPSATQAQPQPGTGQALHESGKSTLRWEKLTQCQVLQYNHITLHLCAKNSTGS